MKYKVNATFFFDGAFEVEAESKEEARGKIKSQCWCILSQGISSDLDDNEIDWEFPLHGEIGVGKATEIR